MKKTFRKLGMATALVLAMVGFVACGDDDDDDNGSNNNHGKGQVTNNSSYDDSHSSNNSSNDKSGDIASLKREIARWEDKIAEAEGYYENALERYNRNPSTSGKNLVDSYKNSIKEYKAERDRCVRELNSL